MALELAALTCCSTVIAEVVRFEITSRQPFENGREFGETGAYEKMVGTVQYALDPKAKPNAAIVDLEHAPRNAQGRVEFSSDLFILAPKDLSRGNGAALYDVNNRGSKFALWFFNDARQNNDPRADGNGFLMRHGFTVVWSGWNGELLPSAHRPQLHPPVARAEDGPIVGPVRYEISPDGEGQTRMAVSPGGHGAYRPTARGLKSATLTVRLNPGDPRVPIPPSQFSLHLGEVESKHAGQLPVLDLELPAGFKKAHLYELIYEARDPVVHGVTFASVRDLMSALRQGEGPGNPLLVDGGPGIVRTYGFGVSQAGRYLREFIYWGFNQDEKGRPAFDGLIPLVSGAGLGSFNHRFAQPTVYATQRRDHFGPIDRFPFAYETQDDALTGERDGILQRCVSAAVAPRVMHLQSSAEYWSRSGSLVHTDTTGKRDARLPETVRVFAFGGTQHTPTGFPPPRGPVQLAQNPGDYHPFLRALLIAMDKWCRDDTPPPASVYPTRREGTLGDWKQSATGFPALPGVRYPEVIQQPPLLDFGPRWKAQRIMDHQPPKIRGHYPVLVARSGADGNELGCLLPPEVAVPIGTFTGWNLRSSAAGAPNNLERLVGAYIPFPVSAAERQSSGDPRLSLDERYGTLEKYRQQLRDECERLVERRLLLQEDVPRIVERVTAWAKPRFEKLGK